MIYPATPGQRVMGCSTALAVGLRIKTPDGAKEPANIRFNLEPIMPGVDTPLPESVIERIAAVEAKLNQNLVTHQLHLYRRLSLCWSRTRSHEHHKLACLSHATGDPYCSDSSEYGDCRRGSDTGHPRHSGPERPRHVELLTPNQLSALSKHFPGIPRWR